jgi:hypothetical protein
MKTNYQERDEKQKQEQANFQRIILEIAPLLGGTVEIDPECKTWIKIQLEGNLAITAHLPYNANNRVEFSGCYPHGLNGRRYSGRDFVPYKETAKDKITCSMKRTPLDIARDILTRLLPEYKRLLALCEKRIAQDKADDFQQKQAMLAVSQVLGVSVDSVRGHGSSAREETIYWHGKEDARANFMTRCNGSEVEIKLQIPTRYALRIAQLVQELS